jgi:stage IV sporulation protein FB
MITIPGKIPIRIHPFFLMLIVLLGWMYAEDIFPALLFAGVAFISVLVHEYGHALTALAFGQRASIDLMAFGGLTQRMGPTLSLWKEFLVVLNGPIAGFLLSLSAYGLLTLLHPTNYVITFMLYAAYSVNLIWTIFNLIPIHPLDGGRLLSIVLEKLFGVRGIKIALFTSMVLAAVFVGISLYLHQVFVAAMLLLFMFENYRSWRLSLDLSEGDRNSTVSDLLTKAEQDMDLGYLDEAAEKFSQVRNEAKKGTSFIKATESLAEILTKQGRANEALEILAPIEKKITPSSLELLQQLFLKTGEYKKGVEVGKKAYQMQPNYRTALLNALCHAHLQEVPQTVGWLQCAEREGLPDLKTVLKMPDFDKIRHDSNFRSLQES